MSAESFLTGSRVYGTPRDDSDVDLVVLLSVRDKDILSEFIDNQEEATDRYEGHGTNYVMGKLNLICVTTQVEFDIWKKGTEDLKAIAPVTREFAVDYFRKLRDKTYENLGTTGEEGRMTEEEACDQLGISMDDFDKLL